ncbi:MAG: ankyrin repeat domain-containing protein [Firmicutes bacterium]|nr:ankyrin repeat domain-containing protein [Bacillota bacterium]
MKKTLMVGVVLVVAVAGILWGLSPDKSLKVHQPQPVQAEAHPQPSTASTSPPQSQPRNARIEIPDVLNFSSCESLTETYSDRRSRWLRERHEGWADYIDDGYSLDAVTVAIEHFLNSNFAASFRVGYLRARTEMGQELRFAQNELERQFPETRDFGLTLRVIPPSQAYKDFLSISPSQREALVTRQPPTINEVAYFTRDSELSDEDIILLLTHVEDVHAEVHYHREESLSILDHVIISGRLPVVQKLLEQGVRPSEDAYLGSSMEHALVMLDYAQAIETRGEPDCCPREADAAAIVALMQQYGSAARFTTQSSDQVEGDIPRRAYRFDADAITHLRQQYGLDLTTITVRHGPNKADAKPLIDKIAADLTQYLASNTDAQQLETQIEQCRELLRDFYQAWQPMDANHLIMPLVEQYADDIRRIEAELSAIDPGLVDHYRHHQWIRGLVRFRYPFDSEVKSALENGDPDPAIAFILALDIDAQDQVEYALHVLTWNNEYLQPLMRSGLLPSRPDYFLMDRENLLYDMGRLEQLENLGLDLRGEDSIGQTVLHIAVRDGRSNLVSELVAEGFPFGGRGLNQDPLHAALNPSNSRLPIQTMEPIVRELMTYQPEVDIFHHRRLAVMQLKYPEVYQALVADFPELEVPEGTELMPVRL